MITKTDNISQRKRMCHWSTVCLAAVCRAIMTNRDILSLAADFGCHLERDAGRFRNTIAGYLTQMTALIVVSLQMIVYERWVGWLGVIALVIAFVLICRVK